MYRNPRWHRHRQSNGMHSGYVHVEFSGVFPIGTQLLNLLRSKCWMNRLIYYHAMIWVSRTVNCLVSHVSRTTLGRKLLQGCGMRGSPAQDLRRICQCWWHGGCDPQLVTSFVAGLKMSTLRYSNMAKEHGPFIGSVPCLIIKRESSFYFQRLHTDLSGHSQWNNGRTW